MADPKRIGRVVKTPARFMELLKQNRAVYVTTWERTSAVAFLANWPFKAIMRMIQAGYFKEYGKK